MRRAICHGRFPSDGGWSIGQAHMAVCASKTKGTDAGHPGRLTFVPDKRLGWDEEWSAFKRNIGVQILKVEIGRNLFAPQGKYHLDQACDACRGFQMANIRLD